MKDCFIWVQYGQVKVYEIENFDSFLKLLVLIDDCVDGWQLDDYIRYTRTNLSDKSTRATIINLFDKLLRQIGIGTCDEFEYGTGFSKILVL